MTEEQEERVLQGKKAADGERQPGGLANATDAWIDGWAEQIFLDIARLIRIPSVTGRTEENRQCLEAYLDVARDMGFSVKKTTTNDVGIVDLPANAACAAAGAVGRPERVGILVHLDVVEPGDRQQWTNDPFEPVIRDSRLYGRGAEDDKGPAVAALYALRAVKEQNQERYKDIRLLVGTSEESHWFDMEHYLAEFPGEGPDYGFTPDGDFPIFYRESGYADVYLRFSDDRYGLLNLSAGDSPNTIPAFAELESDRGMKMRIEGKSAHSSTPELGLNAIFGLCELIEDQPVLQDKRFSRLLNWYRGEERLELPFSLEGTPSLAVPTRLWLEGDDILLVINVRHAAGTGRDDLVRVFDKLGKDYQFTYEIKEYMDPLQVEPEQPFLSCMEPITRAAGMTEIWQEAGGTSYAKAMPHFVSWGPVFPDETATAHMEDESISAPRLIQATKMYAAWLACVATMETSGLNPSEKAQKRGDAG